MHHNFWIPPWTAWIRAGILLLAFLFVAPIWRQMVLETTAVNPGQSRLTYVLVPTLVCLPIPVIGVAYLHHWFNGPDGYTHPRLRSWWEGSLTLIIGSLSLLPIFGLHLLLGRALFDARLLTGSTWFVTAAHLYGGEQLLRQKLSELARRLARRRP